MNKAQWGAIILSGVLVVVLFFGFDTKPKEQKALEKSRVLMAESADIQVLLSEAKTNLSSNEQNELLRLESELQLALGDTVKMDWNRQLSGEWYRLGEYAIAGHYAQEVAELLQTGESWSIAGSTYYAGIKRSDTEKKRKYSMERALQAFENAISLEPENAVHQVNLALVYTESPPQDNPMKGIQMLLQLNQDEPENVLVLGTLARLAIQTGQYDRAEERLLKAVSLQADDPTINCLLVRLYQEMETLEKAAPFAAKCTGNADNGN